MDEQQYKFHAAINADLDRALIRQLRGSIPVGQANYDDLARLRVARDQAISAYNKALETLAANLLRQD